MTDITLDESITNTDVDTDKEYIVSVWLDSIKDKPICTEGQNTNHCGKIGHWLESKFGLASNSNNEPDIRGYELKTGKEVTTFIDKAPDETYVDGNIIPKRNNRLAKKRFWEQYGCKKQSDAPTVGGWRIGRYNYCGQRMLVDESDNILVEYDYDQDQREYKNTIAGLPQTPHLIMRWNAESLKQSVERKFNQKVSSNSYKSKIHSSKCVLANQLHSMFG